MTTKAGNDISCDDVITIVEQKISELDIREQPKRSKSGNPDGDGGDDSSSDGHSNGSKQNKNDNQEPNGN